MFDDLTHQYRLLAHTAALVGEFDGSPERQKELLAWALEAVRTIAAARGLQVEPRQPEPMPHHISRELWPAQGERGDEDTVAERSRREVTVLEEQAAEQPDPEGARDCHCALWPSGGPFRKNDGHFHHPDCSQAPQNRARPSGQVPLDPNQTAYILPDPKHCACRSWALVMPLPLGEWSGGHHPRCPRALRPTVEAGAGFAPGELARAGGGEEREE